MGSPWHQGCSVLGGRRLEWKGRLAALSLLQRGKMPLPPWPQSLYRLLPNHSAACRRSDLWCRDSRRRVFGDSAQTGAFLGGTVDEVDRVNAVGCSARAKRTRPWAPVQETVNGAAPMVSGKMRERRREWCMAVPWWLGYSMCWTPSASMRAATGGSLSRSLGFG